MSALGIAMVMVVSQPNICSIETPPKSCSQRGDPVNLLTGFSFHEAQDLAIESGNGLFAFHRYFMPIGSLGGSKSPLTQTIGQMWPSGAPNGPFGKSSGEERPVWSNDFFSFVVPCPTAGGGCSGAPSAMALVFDGNFQWTIFNRSGSVGFQTPNRKNIGTPVRLETLSDGYRVIRASGSQWFYRRVIQGGANKDTHPMLLTEVRDRLGRQLVALGYPSTGCSNLPSEGVFASGAKLVLEYSASPACLLQNVAYLPPGAALAQKTVLANYSYWGGVAGRLSSAGPASRIESYDYTAGAIGWSFGVARGGRAVSTHDYIVTGAGVTSYDGHGAGEQFDLWTSMESLADGPLATPYLACSVVTDDVLDDGTPIVGGPLQRHFVRGTEVYVPSSGSPSLGSAYLTESYFSYNTDLFGTGAAELGERRTTCTSAACPKADDGSVASWVQAIAPLHYNAANVCSDGRAGGGPGVPYSTKNKRGWWSATRLALVGGEQTPVLEAFGMAASPAQLSDGGFDTTGALEIRRLNTQPEFVGSIRVNERTERASVLPGAAVNSISDQRLIDTGAIGGVPTRFVELEWVSGNTRTLAGTTVAQLHGTFYRRARACAPSANDPLNRVLRIEGPCVIAGPSSTTCSGTSYPVTEFTYHSNSATPNEDRGRLQKISRYPQFTTTSCGLELATTFSNYTAEGLPQTVTDANGVVATLGYSGDLLVSRVVGSYVTSFAYEADGSLRHVRRASTGMSANQGHFEVHCRHNSSASGGCDFASPLLPRVTWIAKASDPSGSDFSERQFFSHRSDGTVSSVEYQTNSQGVVTSTFKRHSYPDVAGRPTWDGVGAAAASAVKRVAWFDANDNPVALGSSFTQAPDFCRESDGSLSLKCMHASWDRADRLVETRVFPVGTQASMSKTCLDYDSAGNPRRVIQGCVSSDVCSANRSDGAVSVCASGAPPVDFDVDDFDRVVAVRAPGAGEVRYEYNALGLVVKRETQVMRNSGVREEFEYDQLGRLTRHTRAGSGGAVQLSARVWDVAISGSGCPLSATAARVLGRLGYRDDTFGRTGYVYDDQGRVLAEYGQRAGSPAPLLCDSSYVKQAYFPTTTYGYTWLGAVAFIRYPHGRTVGYLYGAGPLADRVTAVTATNWSSVAGAFTAPETVLADVKWFPFAGVRGYSFNTVVSGAGRWNDVTNLIEGVPSGELCSADFQALSSSDLSGRPTGLWVRRRGSFPYEPPQALLKTAYSWNGEELSEERSCSPLLGQSVEDKRVFGYDLMHRLTAEERTGSPRMTHALGVAVPAAALTTWGYDSRSNRTAMTVDGCPHYFTRPGGVTRDQLSVTAPNNGSACRSRFSGPSLTWDSSARLSQNATAYGFGKVDFGFDDPAKAGLDSVYHQARIASYPFAYSSFPVGGYAYSTYQYYYDAFNRRRLKVLPTGATQEFFYGFGNQLLTEVTAATVNGPNWAVEDTIWLGGAPVAIVRGEMHFDGVNYVRGNEAPTASCQKLSDGAFCGVYNVVTDRLTRPVMMVRQSTGEITQLASYDPWGRVNRVSAITGVDNNNGWQSLGVVSLPKGNKRVRMRANYVVNPGVGVYLGPQVAWGRSAVPRVNAVSLFVATSADSISMSLGESENPPPPSGGLPGLQINEIEYFRTSAGYGFFTSLRLPGQYYDPELDVVENWNRYMDPYFGIYLSPEPLLQSPGFVAMRAQLGVSVPTYAYAGNNPIGSIDPSGLGDFRISPSLLGDPDVLAIQAAMAAEVKASIADYVITDGTAPGWGKTTGSNPNGTPTITTTIDTSKPGMEIGETAHHESLGHARNALKEIKRSGKAPKDNKGWKILLESDDSNSAACAAGRTYRKSKGLDPIEHIRKVGDCEKIWIQETGGMRR